MDTMARARNYLRQQGKTTYEFVLEIDAGVKREFLFPGFSGPRRRRLVKKSLAGHDYAGHRHDPRTRCESCKPLSGKVTGAMVSDLTAMARRGGPRDWLPFIGGRRGKAQSR